MKMTNEEIDEIRARAEDEYEMLKDRVHDLYDENKGLKQEIERLNNIINELEEELDRGYRDLFEHELVPGRELITNIKNYLQELKGVDNNGNNK